ncbi:unnamed protein product [Meganyctiphanes norvegica]|uniref:Major facilitator superfamily associated domain-containing protein n=1 Tax=Meganyctiphanes norvegica TaxID=48144 RepID=A0AAV2Q8T0_MEGNR
MASRINRKLLPVKIHNFLRYGGNAIAPFLPVIVSQKGVSPNGVGFMWSCFNICNIFTFLFISKLADRFSIHRLLFFFGLTSILAGVVGIYYTPNLEIHVSSQSYLNSYENITLNTRQIQNKNFLELCSENIELRFPCLNENWNYSITEPCTVRCELSEKNSNSTSIKNNYEHLDFELNYTNFVNGEKCVRIENVKRNSYYSNITNPMVNTHLLCIHYNLKSENKSSISIIDYMEHYEFWLIVLFLIMNFCGMSACMNMGDTATFEILQDKRHKFGFQRLFGSLAIGIMGITYGAAIDYFSKDLPERNYTSAFVLSIIMLMLATITGIFIEFKIPKKVKQFEEGVRKIIGSTEVILFMGIIMMGGISQGSLWSFYFLFMEEVSLSWDKEFLQRNLLQGLTMAIGCFLGEVPFNYAAGFILKKVGHIKLLAFTLIAYSVRFVLYFLVKNPWYFIPIEVLHGLSFGILCPVMFTYANILSTPGTRATLQGITSAVFTLGVSLSSLVCGVLYKTIGGGNLYLYIGILDAAFVAIYLTAHVFITKKDTEDKDIIEEDDDDQSRPLNNGKVANQILEKSISHKSGDTL